MTLPEILEFNNNFDPSPITGGREGWYRIYTCPSLPPNRGITFHFGKFPEMRYVLNCVYEDGVWHVRGGSTRKIELNVAVDTEWEGFLSSWDGKIVKIC